MKDWCNKFDNQRVELNDIEEINIFLAGNSSKSQILRELFDIEIEKHNKQFRERLKRDSDVFKIYEPLSNDDNFEKPNAKTGVAFGLIETRKSGNIYVIDHNIQSQEREIGFKYYLGINKKKKFKVIIERDTEYKRWINFTDASIDSFEVYYTSQSIVTRNDLPISDNSIKKLILNTDIEDDDAYIYIRVVSPTEFEYAVAYEDDIENEEYLSQPKRVRL